jgi:hypothetical protein
LCLGLRLARAARALARMDLGQQIRQPQSVGQHVVQLEEVGGLSVRQSLDQSALPWRARAIERGHATARPASTGQTTRPARGATPCAGDRADPSANPDRCSQHAEAVHHAITRARCHAHCPLVGVDEPIPSGRVSSTSTAVIVERIIGSPSARHMSVSNGVSARATPRQWCVTNRWGHPSLAAALASADVLRFSANSSASSHAVFCPIILRYFMMSV